MRNPIPQSARPEPRRRCAVVAALALASGPWCLTPTLATEISGVTFDIANATTTATISSGGYITTPTLDAALPSWTSPRWTAGNSLGTYFQVPDFQPGYSSNTKVTGAVGTGATLGQDPDFPPTNNVRDMIMLTWGSGNGLENQGGDDLAVFEQATSEAFAIRVHVAGGNWTNWRYQLHNGDYNTTNDATATLFDLTAFGVAGGAFINVVEITNLIAEDRVHTQIDTTGLGYGYVTFAEDNPLSLYYVPGRYSTSAGAHVPFETGKYDPDIQYVVGLHAVKIGNVPAAISPLESGSPLSTPARFGPTPAPEPGALALLAAGLGLLAARRRARGST